MSVFSCAYHAHLIKYCYTEECEVIHAESLVIA